MQKIIKIYLELSFRCNLKCKFCYAGDIQNKKNHLLNFFDFKDIELIKNNLKKIFIDGDYIYDIDILGGESLLNKQFIEIITYITSNYNTRFISLTTNGSLLNKDLILNLKKVGITEFRISLHGSELIHNYLVRGKVFQKVIGNLKILDFLDINYVIIFVYNNINKASLLDLMIFLKKNDLNIKKLFIEFVEFSGYGLDNINELNLIYNQGLKSFFNKQLYYLHKIFGDIQIAISNFPKCMLDTCYHKNIDDNYSKNEGFELYYPLLVRKIFQNFDKKEIQSLIRKNIECGYKISYQEKLNRNFIPNKCRICIYNTTCYLLVKENILYDYLGFIFHKRKHYFELNDTIIN